MSEHAEEQAKWWHSENPSPALSRNSLGTFFFETLNGGGKIGMVWPFNPYFERSLVTVSVFMTPNEKAVIENRTKFRFRTPPRIGLVQYDETRADRYEDWKPVEDAFLRRRGGRWFHSDVHHSPSLSKAALGEFFYELLKAGAQIGMISLFRYKGTAKGTVYVTAFMTDEMKQAVEERTRFKFRDPPGPAFDD